jgi:hypothetical protein
MIAAAFGLVRAEEPATHPSAAKKSIYTDYHIHVQSKQMAKVFKAVNGSDTFGANKIEETSAEKILALLDEAGLDRAFVLPVSYLFGNAQVAGPKRAAAPQ